MKLDIGILNINNLTNDEINKFNTMRSYISARKIKSIQQKDIAEQMGLNYRQVHALEKRYSSIDDNLEKEYRRAVEALLEAQKGNKDNE